MSPRDLEACRMFQPAEKACWEILLREYPDFRDVPQAALDSAMEKSLQQLWSVLTAESVEEWLKTQENETPLSAKGDCALNVLLPYFNTGQHALQLVSKELSDSCPEISEGDRGRVTAEISAGFKLLVHWQLQGACSRCHQAPLCRFGDKAGHCAVSPGRSPGSAVSAESPSRTPVARAARRDPVVTAPCARRAAGSTQSPPDAKSGRKKSDQPAKSHPVH